MKMQVEQRVQANWLDAIDAIFTCIRNDLCHSGRSHLIYWLAAERIDVIPSVSSECAQVFNLFFLSSQKIAENVSIGRNARPTTDKFSKFIAKKRTVN